MINVDEIFNGFVLDHIQAGRSMAIYHYLNLDELDCQVAIIKNARSGKMGRKDIIKVEGPLDIVDFDVLGFIDHNITVDIIKDGKLIEKRELKLPKKIVNVLHCKNPRCITSIEQELEHVFVLTDKENGTYSCQYCEEKQGKLWENYRTFRMRIKPLCRSMVAISKYTLWNRAYKWNFTLNILQNSNIFFTMYSWL